MFWQLIFINATGWLTFESELPTTTYVDGPLPPSDSCAADVERGMLAFFPMSYWTPGGTNSVQTMTALETLNSSAWAPTATDHVGSGFQTANGGVVAYYSLSYSTFNGAGWSTGAWVVHYSTCGLSGRLGFQNWSETGWGVGTSPTEFYGQQTGQITCPANADATFNATLTKVTTSSLAGGWLTAGSLAIGLSEGGGRRIYNDTADYLAAWMVTIGLVNGSGGPISPIDTNCTANATRVSTCGPPPTGWYAVLVSRSGWVLDTYSSDSEIPGWQVPNVSVVNNDSLVVLSSFNVVSPGCTLTFESTFSLPLIDGSYQF